MKNTRWPPERIKRLVELFDEGLEYAAIGVAIGCTTSAAKNQLHRLKMKRRPKGEVVKAQPLPPGACTLPPLPSGWDWLS